MLVHPEPYVYNGVTKRLLIVWSPVPGEYTNSANEPGHSTVTEVKVVLSQNSRHTKEEAIAILRAKLDEDMKAKAAKMELNARTYLTARAVDFHVWEEALP